MSLQRTLAKQRECCKEVTNSCEIGTQRSSGMESGKGHRMERATPEAYRVSLLNGVVGIAHGFPSVQSHQSGELTVNCRIWASSLAVTLFTTSRASVDCSLLSDNVIGLPYLPTTVPRLENWDARALSTLTVHRPSQTSQISVVAWEEKSERQSYSALVL